MRRKVAVRGRLRLTAETVRVLCETGLALAVGAERNTTHLSQCGPSDVAAPGIC